MSSRNSLLCKMRLLARAMGHTTFCPGDEPTETDIEMVKHPMGFYMLVRTIMYDEVPEVFESDLLEHLCPLALHLIGEVEEIFDEEDEEDERESLTGAIQHITIELLGKLTQANVVLEKLLRKAVSVNNRSYGGYLIDLMETLGFQIPTDLKPTT